MRFVFDRRHCEERSDEAIHSFFLRRDGLLRFARNDVERAHAGARKLISVRVNARDGAAIRDEATLTITALEDSELVLVDAA